MSRNLFGNNKNNRKSIRENSKKTRGGPRRSLSWADRMTPASGEPISRTRMQVRVTLLAVIFVIFFVVLVARLWQLQVLSGEDYSASAQQVHTREVSIPAQRGVIYDRDGQVLVNNSAGLSVTVVPEEIDRGKLQELAGILGADRQAVLKRYDEAEASGSSYDPILVQENATGEDVTYVSERTGEFPGVLVEDDYVRNYAQGKTASHVLGYTGAVSQEELEASDGELANDATVGKSGIELVYEDLLRGEPGKRTYSVDAQGRVVDENQKAASAEEQERIEAEAATEELVPGHDLHLSIDTGLQRTVERELKRAVETGKQRGFDPTGGATVALDPDTGEILAMASYPEFDPRLFVGGVSGAGETAEYEALVAEGSNSPLTNRAVSGAHPAASTFKAFTGLAGLAYGVVNPSTTFTDGGSCWRPDGAESGCWQSWRQFEDTGTDHGTQDYSEALADSNDKYFYEIADRLWQNVSDRDLLPEYYERFGFGERTDVDLPGESEGRIPTQNWQRENGATAEERYWGVGRWVNMSIGQGDVLVTPVQLATAYAAIQNGGTLVEPHLALEARSQEGEVVEELADESSGEQIEVTGDQLSATREGLRAVTGPSGTAASIFENSPLDVVGKTGTAESGAGKEDSIGWFAGWAEDQEDSVVVVTMVEGGGGYEVAVPSVRRVLEKHHGAAPDNGKGGEDG